jgi:hypothetical protein
MKKDNDFFNGEAYKRIKLSQKLLEKGILDISVNREPRQISLSYEHQGKQMQPLVVSILEFPYPTVDQLDKLVNGTMSLDTLTEIKAFIILNLGEHWSKLYNGNGNANEQEKERTSKAKLALQTGENCAKKLFIDEYQTAHAVISVNDHLETLRLESKRFRNYLASETYKAKGTMLDAEAMKSVIGILSARAEFDGGDPIRLNLRVAQVEKEGKLTWYYDLTNKEWEFIEITANGWKLVKNQDPNLVLFHRYNNQLAQVYPSREYDPNILDRFIELVLNDSNVNDNDKLEEYRILLKGYMICALIADIPKVILTPHGSQGAAKTTLFELVKTAIDPSSTMTFTLPNGINEFIQQLDHNLVAFYDNVSTLKDWQSDQICRATSGAASSKRLLYSDDDDFIRSFMRNIGLNGINLAATKPDILDRSLFIELSRISDDKRKYIKKIKKDFEEMRPQLLGYILDVLVKVMAWIEQHGGMIDLSKLPRMADWAGYCEIISRCIGLPDGKFIDAYTNNAKIQIDAVMETSEVAACLQYFVETDSAFEQKGLIGEPMPGFEGTATQLKKKLEDIAPAAGIDIKSKDWPKKPNGLTRIINIIMHTLKEADIEIESYHSKTGRIIKISKVSSPPSPSSPDENRAQNDSQKGDDGGDDDNSKVSSPKNEQNRAQNGG